MSRSVSTPLVSEKQGAPETPANGSISYSELGSVHLPSQEW